MRKLKTVREILTLILILILTVNFGNLFNQNLIIRNIKDANCQETKIIDDGKNRLLLSKSNYDIISEILDEKVNSYNSLNYFPEYYEPSLQAVYYAVFIMNTIGKLNEINATEIINYVLSCYNSSSGEFYDIYSLRYLDIDPNLFWYPLTSPLDTTCYALLTLKMLNATYLIDITKSLNYILSCYNTKTSGFIGKPYSEDLKKPFNISTMDNTYFAILTINETGNWDYYSQYRAELIQYIQSLQSYNSYEYSLGGFYNDKDLSFNSLQSTEPNLIASYYCIKSLQIFGVEDSINLENFRQFLGVLYDSQTDRFKMPYTNYPEYYTDIIATALGFELSEIVGFSGINRTETLNFIINNVNQFGGWNSTSFYSNRELIDTFQVIRVLSNTGNISRLNSQQILELSNYINLFKSCTGYSLLSRDYTSLKNLWSIAYSFYMNDKISDLELHNLYKEIKGAYYYDDNAKSSTFYGNIRLDSQCRRIRSFPIEYYTYSKHNKINMIDTLMSHKATFYALDALKKIYKLDDFAANYNLSVLLHSIECSQYLGNDYNKYGGFLPSIFYASYPEGIKKRLTFLENSYYAIRSLEILNDFLGGTKLDGLDFNKTALYTFIFRHTYEDAEYIYYNVGFTDDTIIRLKNTYFMVYILKALELYSLDSQKISNFIKNVLNYDDFVNFYYCYKISELLNLEIQFNATKAQQLVKSIYKEEYHDFIPRIGSEIVSVKILAMVSDVAKHSELDINAEYYNNIQLGSYNMINVSIYNLILDEFKTSISVFYESEQLSTSVCLNKVGDNDYIGEVYIPPNPENFPGVIGFICIYDGITKIAEFELNFNTTYELKFGSSIEENINNLFIYVNVSIITSNGYQAIHGAQLFAKLFLDNSYLGDIYFNSEIKDNYTLFSKTLILEDYGEYKIELYLDDTFRDNFQLIHTEFFNFYSNENNNSNTDSNSDNINNNELPINFAPIPILLAALPSIALIYAILLAKKSERMLGKR
ncbi:MAG: prenyltransferase/squalene oxidase repeat-containing protein [Promethearchaeota archaeon]